MNTEQISIYFNAEKSAGLFLFIFGIAVILFSFYLLIKVKKQYYKGLAISLVTIAFIQTLAGLTVYYTSDQDIARVENYLKLSPQQLYPFQSGHEKIGIEEIPRMQSVYKSLIIFRYVEIALIQ